eukprot:10117927-Heterocapsa_arctica.AAC.1
MKEKKKHKYMVKFNQERMNHFWAAYQVVAEDVDGIYQEQEDLGWNQVTDHDSDNPVSESSDEEPGLITAVGLAEKNQFRRKKARENTVDLTGDDDMPP